MAIDSSQIKFFPSGGIVSPQGYRAGSARAGIKESGDDIALLVCGPATASAVFTRNVVRAAPVLVSAEHLQQGGKFRAVVVNSGNANACTGEQGLADARQTCVLVAEKVGCKATEVLVCSTGIIGRTLPMPRVELALSQLQPTTEAEQNESCARAIMTTDTRPKFCAASTSIDGQTVTVGGMVKGVGMIGPDMGSYSPPSLHATLLAFITTDAKIEALTLQEELQRVVDKTFNSVTVDGDTSTNDTAIILANGASGVTINSENLPPFRALLEEVCVHLVREVARDGEGATKLVTIKVREARSAEDAKKAALTIANSPLVKTAVFGNDPNWGRIAMAAGRSGADFDARNLKIHLGGVQVFVKGEPAVFDQEAAEAALRNDEVEIEVSLGAGNSEWIAWTCDFSYDYVKINAEYHT